MGAHLNEKSRQIAGMSTVLSSHHAASRVQKSAKPTHAKKMVSAAAIFKQGPQKKAYNSHRAQKEYFKSKIVEPASESDANAETQPNPRKPHKSVPHPASKSEHPLVIEFRNSKNEYRQQLYQSATLQIDSTLDSLLSRLHLSTLNTNPELDHRTDEKEAEGQDAETHPTKLETYNHVVQRLHLPLSHMILTLRTKNEAGEVVRFRTTLERRMAAYKDELEDQRKAMVELQHKWERIVGEIWKLGVTLLGDDAMEEMLGIETPAGKKVDRDADIESTLFVHSTPSPEVVPKKRVTFVGAQDLVLFDKDEGEGAAKRASNVPAFLTQPTKFREGSLPVVLDIEEEDLENLKASIAELGDQQVTAMQAIESDYKKYWKKKRMALVNVLEDEDD